MAERIPLEAPLPHESFPFSISHEVLQGGSIIAWGYPHNESGYERTSWNPGNLMELLARSNEKEVVDGWL